MKLKDPWSWEKSYDQPRQHIKKQRHYFADKGPASQGYGFSSSHVWMWELDYKESWVPKNGWFWTELEKTLMLGKIEGKRRRGWWRMRWMDGITNSMDMSLHKPRESTQTHVHWVDEAIQPSYPLSSLSSPALNLSQHQGPFQWVSSSHQEAKVL